MTEFNRRSSDQPDVIQRVARVEDAVITIKDNLAAHITDETADFKTMGLALERLTVVAERQDARADKQDKQLERITEALNTVAQHSVRVDALESRSSKSDEVAEKVETRLDVVESRVQFLWWAAPIVVLVVGAAWTVLTHFNVI